jgi:hypothetical protein
MGMADKKYIKEFLSDHINQTTVEQKVKAILNSAELIFTGSILDNDPTRNFYIYNDIILCLDKEANNILTLYKIDYGFPSQTNLSVVKDLVAEVRRLMVLEQTVKIDIEVKNDNRKAELQTVVDEIETAKAMIERLNKKKHIIEEEIQLTEMENDQVHKDIRKYALQLVNSWEYKRDFMKDFKR